MSSSWFTRAAPKIATISLLLLFISLTMNFIQTSISFREGVEVPLPKAVPKYVRPYAIKQAVIPQNEGGIGEKKLDDDNGKEEYENNDDGDDAAAPTADNDDDADEMMKILADHADFSTQKNVSTVKTSAIEEVQEERQRHLRQVCASMGYNPDHTSPLDIGLKNLNQIFVFPKYKLLYCAIPKVSCASWKLLFLYLHGHIKSQHGTSEPHAMADRSFQKLSQLQPEAASKALKEYTSFVFVRNPYTKILSAYNDKFVRHPVLGKWRQMVRGWSLKNRPGFKPPPGGAWNVSFDEFVRHYIGAKYKEIHWEDMFKTCHPCHVHYNFIGFYETLEADSDYILSHVGVPPDIRLVSQSDLTKKQTFSSSDKSLTSSYSQLSDRLFTELSKSPGLRRDCELFDYKMPDCLKRD